MAAQNKWRQHVEEIRRRYVDERETAKSIAASFGVKENTLGKTLQRYGIRRPEYPRAWSREEVARVVTIHRGGLSFSQIAGVYGVGRGAIAGLIHRNG